MCIFCKYWRGERPQIDHRTGKCKIRPVRGRCVLDETGQYYKADNLCDYFDKCIVYM